MKVCWLSAGVSSTIASLIEPGIDECIYCHIEDQHEDTLRFLHDSEIAIGGKVTILQSRYKSVSNVIETFRYINGAAGAKCTEILKKRVRKEWEYGKTDLTYVWGFDWNERHRAERTVELMPEYKHKFPLIEKQLLKEDCHGILRMRGIRRPRMYDLGYRNNNCIGCVKGGMGYWNKIREDFPSVFAERARQERLIGHTCIEGVYLDELEPGRGKYQYEVMEECGIMCQLLV